MNLRDDLEDGAVNAMLGATASHDWQLAPPGPVPPPRPPERRLPSLTVPALVGLAAVGMFSDLALRTRLASVAGCVATVAMAILLIRSGSVRGWLGRAAIAAAVLLSLWLPLRSSPWLVAPNVLAIVALLTAATMVERLDGWSITLPRIFGLLPRLAHAVFGPVAVVKSVFDGGRGLTDGRGGALVRGVAVTILPVTILVALLASADAVFASLFSFVADVGQLFGHAFVAGVVAIMAAGLLVVAHVEPSSIGDGGHRRWLGAVESTVLLASMVVVYGAFVATQVVTALGGADHVLETAGLTQAEYARSGFFQMLAAAAMDDRRATRRHRLLSVACSLLTIAVVGVSISRLSLYADAFGLTMLRLYSTIFAGFVGVVFVLFIIDLFADDRSEQVVGSVIGVRRRAWFIPAVGLVAWGLLMGLNGFSPEKIVSDRNLEHRTTQGEFDVHYATSLSADAVPALFAGLEDGPLVDGSGDLQTALCDRWAHTTNDVGYGVFGFNQSRDAAYAAAADACS